MIETVESPAFSEADFAMAGKRPGISAMIRLHNEEDFAEASILSILPFVDEVVVVYNTCSDRTPEIVAALAASEPQRLRVFHYLPEVFPQGSEQHSVLPASSVHSLVYYSNFALSKARYSARFMWAGDQIAEPHLFAALARRLRELRPGSLAWRFSPHCWGYWWYTGVNLWDSDGQVFVPMPRALMGRARDHALWPAGRWTTYRRHPRVEYLFTRLLWPHAVGPLFFHVKGMKRDRGVGVYQLERNPRSPYARRVVEEWTKPRLVTFAEFCDQYPAARHMAAPQSLGIAPLTR